MSTNLVKVDGLPEYLQPMVNESGEHQEAFGTLKPADFGIGFIKLAQQMSRELKAGQNGEPALPLGTMFISRDRTIIPPGTPFIPLYRKVSYIRWLGKPGDGRMDFATDRENDPRIVKIDGLSFKKNARTGETEPPLVTAYYNFYVWTKACENEPLILSFYRTGTKLGRKFTQDLFRATKAAKLPLYSTLFTFGQPSIERDGQQEWYQFCIQPAGFAPERLIAKAAEMFDLAKTLANASSGLEFSSLEDSEASNVSTATGPAIDATATILEPAANAAAPAAISTPPAPQQQTAAPAVTAAPPTAAQKTSLW